MNNNIKPINVAEKAREYAILCHQKTAHFYDGYLPYEFHLRMAVQNANRFKHLIPDYDFDNVEAACWCHDLLEDTRETYSDVRYPTNAIVAELVYALTNEKGRNRKERGNDKYYEGIRQTKHASFVKLCDRIANVEYSIFSGRSDKVKMYFSENQDFCKKVGHDPSQYEIITYLKGLFEKGIIKRQSIYLIH